MPSRYADVDEFYAELEPEKSDLIQRIYATVMADFPQLRVKIAWNQPVLCLDGAKLSEELGLKKPLTDKYVAGMSAATNWLLYNPFSKTVMNSFADRISELNLHASLHTFRVPLDWQIDAQLLRDMTAARLAEIDRELDAKR